MTRGIPDLTGTPGIRSSLPLITRRAFFAMNTDIHLVTRSWQDVRLLAGAEELFHAIERSFSRFLPSSELSRLNRCAGREVRVSQQMFHLLGLSLAFHRLSEGVFDPAVLPSLEAAGYDRSFERTAPRARPRRRRGSPAAR